MEAAHQGKNKAGHPVHKTFVPEKKLEKNRIYNFAVGKPVSAKSLIDTIVSLMGHVSGIQKISDVRQHELVRQDVDFFKARRILGWKPKTDLVKGLTETIAWYKTHYDTFN